MDFHRYWIWGLLVLLIGGCVSCSMGGDEKKGPMTPEKLEQLIKAARKAGCVVKGINIDAYMETVQIVCQGRE